LLAPQHQNLNTASSENKLHNIESKRVISPPKNAYHANHEVLCNENKKSFILSNLMYLLQKCNYREKLI